MMSEDWDVLAPHGFTWSRGASSPVEHICDADQAPLCGQRFSGRRGAFFNQVSPICPTGLGPVCHRCLTKARRNASPHDEEPETRPETLPVRRRMISLLSSWEERAASASYEASAAYHAAIKDLQDLLVEITIEAYEGK